MQSIKNDNIFFSTEKKTFLNVTQIKWMLTESSEKISGKIN